MSVDRAGVVADGAERGRGREGSRRRLARWLVSAVVVIVAAMLGVSASARAANCSLADYAYNGACGPQYESPAWGDGSGWNSPSKYTTIQLADITGNGKDELIGRNDDGLEIWTFDTSLGQWRPASGANGRPEVLTNFRSPLPSEPPNSHGADPMVYETIQTADVLGNGTRSIVAQFPDGVHTYDYVPPAGSKSIDGGTWHEEPVGGPAGSGMPPSQYLSMHAVGAYDDPDGNGQVAANLLDQGSWYVHNGSGGWQPTGQSTLAPSSSQPEYYLDNQAGAMPRLTATSTVASVPADVYRTADGVAVQYFDLGTGKWTNAGPPPTSGSQCVALQVCSPFTDNASTNCVPQTFGCFGTNPSWYETMRPATRLRGPGDPDGYVGSDAWLMVCTFTR